MIKITRYRRILVSGLILLGAVMIFLAPSSATDIWVGVVFVTAGFLIELIGITLAHKNRKV